MPELMMAEGEINVHIERGDGGGSNISMLKLRIAEWDINIHIASEDGGESNISMPLLANCVGIEIVAPVRT